MTRVRRGMTIGQVRQIYLPRADAKVKTIFDSYYARREKSGGGYGHEGLGVYGMYQERAAYAKVRLAAELLEKAGLEVSCGAIRKVTGQATCTVSRYWHPPRQNPPEDQDSQLEDECVRVIPFPG